LVSVPRSLPLREAVVAVEAVVEVAVVEAVVDEVDSEVEEWVVEAVPAKRPGDVTT